MKSINLPPIHFIANPLKAVKNESLSTGSPYLRAILSGRTWLTSKQETNRTDNPDRQAASRYIKESKQLRKK